MVERVEVDPAGGCSLHVNQRSLLQHHAAALVTSTLMLMLLSVCRYNTEYLTHSICCCNLTVHIWHGVGGG
jgi:hypothetical protein